MRQKKGAASGLLPFLMLSDIHFLEESGPS